MDTSFHEVSAEHKTQEVPYCHLSVELDHLYMEDFVENRGQLPRRFAQLLPWYTATVAAFSTRHTISQPRVSTCFLIDDYFSELIPPEELIGPLREAAQQAGLPIDYLAREAACAQSDGISLADQVAARLVAVPTRAALHADRRPSARIGPERLQQSARQRTRRPDRRASGRRTQWPDQCPADQHRRRPDRHPVLGPGLSPRSSE